MQLEVFELRTMYRDKLISGEKLRTLIEEFSEELAQSGNASINIYISSLISTDLCIHVKYPQRRCGIIVRFFNEITDFLDDWGLVNHTVWNEEYQEE